MFFSVFLGKSHKCSSAEDNYEHRLFNCFSLAFNKLMKKLIDILGQIF